VARILSFFFIVEPALPQLFPKALEAKELALALHARLHNASLWRSPGL